MHRAKEQHSNASHSRLAHAAESISRAPERDRIVIVSNYTQTLDIIAELCREMKYPCVCVRLIAWLDVSIQLMCQFIHPGVWSRLVRLDGSTSIKNRQKLVNRFNSKGTNWVNFCFKIFSGLAFICIFAITLSLSYVIEWLCRPLVTEHHVYLYTFIRGYFCISSFQQSRRMRTELVRSSQ